MTFTPLDPDVVAADLRPPPLADLAKRARRRTHRRRLTGGAAALTTLAAAVALAWPLDAGRQPDAPAEVPESPVTRYVSPDLAGSPEQHLFMVPLNRTVAMSVGRTGCRITVQLTTDAGTTWTRPGGPPPVENCTPGADLPLRYTIVKADAYRFTIADRSWFTTDAGRTWTTPPRERVVDAFPAGQAGTWLECVNGCDRPRAVDPATGGLLALRGGPPFNRLIQAVWADADTVWAAGAPEAGRPPRVSHSENRGRTWSVPVDLPTTSDNINLEPAGPRRAYVSVLADEPRLAWFGTDDGGRNWTELDLRSDFARLTVSAAGPLLMSFNSPTGQQVWTSTDGGATFSGPSTVDIPAPSSGGTVRGMVVASGEDRVLHLHDGTGWYAIRPPG
jgi:photosystem II stability/assembly factor-like uncharacterized protein